MEKSRRDDGTIIIRAKDFKNWESKISDNSTRKNLFVLLLCCIRWNQK